MRFVYIFIFLIFSLSVSAQSGRVVPSVEKTAQTAEVDFEKMFREANEYARNKFAEYEQKKIPFSENLRLQVLREQKQLAARYAAQLSALNRSQGDDFYYLAMLHRLAGNNDNAQANFKLFAETNSQSVEKLQTARSVLTVMAAERGNISEAENYFQKYQNSAPANPREQQRMNSELASAYFKKKDFAKAVIYAEEADKLTKSLLPQAATRARALVEILDSGKMIFEVYRELGNAEKADFALADLRQNAVKLESNGIYYYAVDNQIKYMIETNRKAAALDYYKKSLAQISTEFKNKLLQNEISNRLTRREKHYNLLGSLAPELVDIVNRIPNESKTLASLRGKVVLIDFWATWCAPCISAFPMLVKLYEEHKSDGFEIIGLTRFYNQIEGEEADRPSELKFLSEFKAKYKLPYSFLIGDNQLNQITYGATAIPTAVIIDRKGIIRYIESGTNENREIEIEENVKRLLAEK